MEANYFFIDGSSLNAQIRSEWRKNDTVKNRRLCIKSFIDYFMTELHDLHRGSFKRAVFYFPAGDTETVARHLQIPEIGKPGESRDLFVKYCGRKIKDTVEWETYLEEEFPVKFKDRVNKKEKGIDIEICCDGIKLAAMGRLERLFVLTNDEDFLPFFRSVKEYGANVSLVHLSSATTVNKRLLQEVDSFDVVPDDSLESMFIIDQDDDMENEDSVETGAGKPTAEPSDLSLADGAVEPVQDDAVSTTKKG